jgi:hypothetical protein
LRGVAIVEEGRKSTATTNTIVASVVRRSGLARIRFGADLIMKRDLDIES